MTKYLKTPAALITLGVVGGLIARKLAAAYAPVAVKTAPVVGWLVS